MRRPNLPPARTSVCVRSQNTDYVQNGREDFWWVARYATFEFFLSKYVLGRLLVPAPLPAGLLGAIGVIAKPVAKLLRFTCRSGTHHVALIAHVLTPGPLVARDMGAGAQVAIAAFICQRPLIVSTGAPCSSTGLAAVFVQNRVSMARFAPLGLGSEKEERGSSFCARAGDLDRFGVGPKIFGPVGVGDYGADANAVPAMDAGGLHLVR